MSASALEHHLAVCTDCARWLETAVAVGRSFRVSGHTPPDLSESILDQVVLPAAGVAARRRVLRLSLALLGFVQWALATPALFGDAATARAAAHLGMHASHESAAWNLALGAAFLAVAVRPTRAAGTIPILATFIGVLALLSLPDLVAGAVARLASHAGVVLGLVLTTLLARSERLRPLPGVTRTGDGAVAPVRSIKRRGAA
jgi:predicted anti-sigma-YlaC factor YlaD